jgi:5,10-methylene-tetrahydrofolate dehydrogenase/methenyl tetrahydrofolate cyclohydrolase
MHSHLKDADVIVSAVGQPGLVTKDDVKEGAVVLLSTIVIVNGPTPPGTGVIAPATSLTSSNSTSHA